MAESKRNWPPSWLVWTAGIIIFLIIFPILLKIIFQPSYIGTSAIVFNPVAIIFNTLRWGTLYLSIAIGLTLYYKIFKFPNFALGEFFVIGGFVGIYLSTTNLFKSTTDDPSKFILYQSVVIAFFVTGIVAVVVEKVVFKRLRQTNSTPQTMMITSLGVSLGLRALIALRYTGATYRYPTTQNRAESKQLPTIQIRIPLSSGKISIVSQNSQGDQLMFGYLNLDLIQIGTIIGLVLVLFILLKTTKWGHAIRAVASNPDLAASSGINVERVYLLSAFLVGGIAGVGGALYSAVLRVDLADALFLLLPAFAVLVLGSVGSLLGAFIAAFIVSFARSYSEPILAGLQVPLERGNLFNFNEVVPFVVLIIVLLFNAKGIGVKVEDKFNSFSFSKLISPLLRESGSKLTKGDVKT